MSITFHVFLKWLSNYCEKIRLSYSPLDVFALLREINECVNFSLAIYKNLQDSFTEWKVGLYPVHGCFQLEKFPWTKKFGWLQHFCFIHSHLSNVKHKQMKKFYILILTNQTGLMKHTEEAYSFCCNTVVRKIYGCRT